MAVLTTANSANIGHGGAMGSKARIVSGRARVFGLGLCQSVEVGQGYPSGRFSSWGASVAPATESDQSAAATLTALSTPSAVDITPLQYVVAVGISMGARSRAIAENDPIERARKDAIISSEAYLMGDDTSGLSELISALSATAGTSGATLTISTALAGKSVVNVATDNSGHACVFLIDGIGRDQLMNDILTNGAALMSNPNVSLASDMVGQVSNEPDGDNGHWLNITNKLAVVVEESSTALDVVSGDKVGCVFLPVNAAIKAMGLSPSRLQAEDEVQPAFGLAFLADPSRGLEDIAFGGVETFPSPVGPITTALRSYNGAASFGLDTRFAAAVGTINASGACKIPYLNS